MAQSEDTPEGDGTSGTKPSFELFETTAGGRLLRGSDGEGGTTEICLRRPTCTRWRDPAHLLRDQLLSQLTAGRGSVAPRVSVPAVGANLNVDLLAGAVQLSALATVMLN